MMHGAGLQYRRLSRTISREPQGIDQIEDGDNGTTSPSPWHVRPLNTSRSTRAPLRDAKWSKTETWCPRRRSPRGRKRHSSQGKLRARTGHWLGTAKRTFATHIDLFGGITREDLRPVSPNGSHHGSSRVIGFGLFPGLSQARARHVLNGRSARRVSSSLRVGSRYDSDAAGTSFDIRCSG
jgi:hypothetical protein